LPRCQDRGDRPLRGFRSRLHRGLHAPGWAVTGFGDALAEDLAIPLVFDLVFFALRPDHPTPSSCSAPWPFGRNVDDVPDRGLQSDRQLVNWIPTVGLAIGLAYGSVLAVIGIQKMHDATLSRAITIVAIPLVLAAGIAGAYLAVS
jgi:hypothetical protein